MAQNKKTRRGGVKSTDAEPHDSKTMVRDDTPPIVPALSVTDSSGTLDVDGVGGGVEVMTSPGSKTDAACTGTPGPPRQNQCPRQTQWLDVATNSRRALPRESAKEVGAVEAVAQMASLTGAWLCTDLIEIAADDKDSGGANSKVPDNEKIPGKFNFSQELERRLYQMMKHIDEDGFTFGVSHLPPGCMWGKLSPEGKDIHWSLVDKTHKHKVTLWTVGELKHWTLDGSSVDKVSMGYMPLHPCDLEACEDLLKRFATDTQAQPNPSPLVWASRWLREKKGGPRVDFESVFDLRKPLRAGEELKTFHTDSLCQDDIVLVEVEIACWWTLKGWKCHYDLQALYFIYRPDNIDLPLPAKKAKMSGCCI
ncbi:hypothetical protein CERSUDRAFT_75986 [Gelatoporia subvermispora B]|uniref:Uncharacterized protein n=1 Tax=Ceriporiopsis subvermispora (strain B) TaxID=914234 RepID=M2R714_CERS8|nr:hypothetical protein CERSUDRAFT_75986 [Gelatoporia subvermispora B]